MLATYPLLILFDLLGGREARAAARRCLWGIRPQIATPAPVSSGRHGHRSRPQPPLAARPPIN